MKILNNLLGITIVFVLSLAAAMFSASAQWQEDIIVDGPKAGYEYIYIKDAGLLVIRKSDMGDGILRKDTFTTALPPDAYCDIPYLWMISPKTIILEDGFTRIEDLTFRNLNKLESVIIPDSVTKIGWGIFSGCDNLKTVVLPKGLTEIPIHTFNSCTSLKQVALPENITKIGDEAFSGCTSLESLYIPETVTEIGERVFDGCTSLKKVVYNGKAELDLPVKPVKPGKVTKIESEASLWNIRLQWAEVEHSDGYRVYSYNPKTKKYTKLKDVKENYYENDKSLKSGTTYYFAVKAYNKNGSKTAWSDMSDVFAVSTKPPAMPTLLKLTSTSKGKANISWSNVSGETGYQVWYCNSKNGKYVKLSNYKANTVKATASKLTSGKTYYFKVRAYKKTGGEYVYSNFSSVKSVKIK